MQNKRIHVFHTRDLLAWSRSPQMASQELQDVEKRHKQRETRAICTIVLKYSGLHHNSHENDFTLFPDCAIVVFFTLTSVLDGVQ